MGNRVISRKLPPFKQLDSSLFSWSYARQLRNPFYYTPLIQLRSPTDQFRRDMRRLSRKNEVTPEDTFNATHAIIQQFVKISSSIDAGFYTNYCCKPNPEFHGVVDFLVYSNNYTKFVPILYFPNRALNQAIFDKKVFNTYATIGAAEWALNNKPVSVESACAIQTDGNRWQMLKVTRDKRLEKTIVYEAENVFRKMYQDEYFQDLVLGLIEEGLQIDSMQKLALTKVYDYIDEKRLSEEVKNSQDPKASPAARLIQKLLK